MLYTLGSLLEMEGGGADKVELYEGPLCAGNVIFFPHIRGRVSCKLD